MWLSFLRGNVNRNIVASRPRLLKKEMSLLNVLFLFLFLMSRFKQGLGGMTELENRRSLVLESTWIIATSRTRTPALSCKGTRNNLLL